MSKVNYASPGSLASPLHQIYQNQSLNLTTIHKRSRRSDSESESERILNNSVELFKIILGKKTSQRKKIKF